MNTDNFPHATPDNHTESAEPVAPDRNALTPRTGPIVWGCLILAFCAYIVQRTFAPETVNATVWITGTLFGLGALLLGVGIAIVARNSRRNSSHR